MEPLDLRSRPPRSCFEELNGLMLMPRTIDKVRSLLPGGDPGGYWIDERIKGISGYLLERLGISQSELLEAVERANDESEIAAWLAQRTDPATYGSLNATLRRIRPDHAEDPAYFREVYAQTLREHPELERIVDIIDADDRRSFPSMLK